LQPLIPSSKRVPRGRTVLPLNQDEKILHFMMMAPWQQPLLDWVPHRVCPELPEYFTKWLFFDVLLIEPIGWMAGFIF
jgi:hypothetical protein